MISCGVSLVTKEGRPELTKNELTAQDQDHVEQVSSLPYQVDFQHPVVKVSGARGQLKFHCTSLSKILTVAIIIVLR